MKIIVNLPVKNDGWCIENAINHLLIWCDHLFIYDASTDDSVIAKYKNYSNSEKIDIIRPRPAFDYNTPDNRNYYLNTARSFDGNNLIFEMHADEIISARILNKSSRENFFSKLRPRSAILMPWLTMWGSPTSYRNDRSVWSRNNCWFAFVDDRVVKFKGPAFHGPRVPEAVVGNKLFVGDLRVMHYQFLNLPHERSKQALYQVYERKHFPSKSIEKINKIYAIAFDVDNIKLQNLAHDEYMPWVNHGLDLIKDYNDDSLNWRDVEVLRHFNAYGVAFFRDINIWFIDWERKRLEAVAKGYNNVPNYSIVDSRTWSTKLSHWWVMRTQTYAFWRLDFINFLFKSLSIRLKNLVFGIRK